MTLQRHSLGKKQVEREHVILNAVKDLISLCEARFFAYGSN
jgi:hypothetical protein